jgi:hypothetical protein
MAIICGLPMEAVDPEKRARPIGCWPPAIELRVLHVDFNASSMDRGGDGLVAGGHWMWLPRRFALGRRQDG